MPETDYGHWDVDLVGEFNPDEHFGFVYQITNLTNDRSYIGCKHLMKYKKGKPIKASEWRDYCSSSKYLKPDIDELGKQNFEFKILLLCANKRDLYYNEMKIQVELGVIESEEYYNANVGGKRFYRPVKSYGTDFKNKIKGIKNGRYRGMFLVTYKGGITNLIKNITIKDFAEENDYSRRCLFNIIHNRQKTHKDIIGLEYVNEKD